MAKIVLIDNHDSFVYNLVDALSATEHEFAVYRNTVDVDTVLAARPDLIILSPGPSHPRDAGHMMELIDRVYGEIPMLGICLGFQALMDHFGGDGRPCGPVPGSWVAMTLTAAGVGHPLFEGLTIDASPDQPEVVGRLVSVARYHSLGSTRAPAPLQALATTPTEIGDVVMAAEARAGGRVTAIGLQFHPESILTPGGPIMLTRCLDQLLMK